MPASAIRRRSSVVIGSDTSTAITRRQVRGDRDAEPSGSCTEIEDRRVVTQAVPTKNLDVGRRVVTGLLFVSGDVVRVEMLLPGVGEFVDPPVVHADSLPRAQLL